MGLLNGTSVYLIGSVDHHKDPGKWRKEIAKDLLRPLGVKVYDPTTKPGWFNDEYPLDCDPTLDFHLFKQLLSTKALPTPAGPLGGPDHPRWLAEKRMWGVRDLCLRMAHDCNFIIASLPKKFTVGTLEELGVAAQAKKPILIYLPDGADTSTWIPAQIGKDLDNFFKNTFSTMEELYDRVRNIDSGDANVDNLSWIFLSYFNDEVVKNEFPDHHQTRDQPARC
jgi:hypothetical protein